MRCWLLVQTLHMHINTRIWVLELGSLRALQSMAITTFAAVSGALHDPTSNMLNLLCSFLICLVCPVLLTTAFQAHKQPSRTFAHFDSTMSDMARPHLVQNDVDVVVIGSGISGSTAAFYMNRKGLNVMVAESQSEAGGNLRTKKGDS